MSSVPTCRQIKSKSIMTACESGARRHKHNARYQPPTALQKCPSPAAPKLARNDDSATRRASCGFRASACVKPKQKVNSKKESVGWVRGGRVRAHENSNHRQNRATRTSGSSGPSAALQRTMASGPMTQSATTGPDVKNAFSASIVACCPSSASAAGERDSRRLPVLVRW